MIDAKHPLIGKLIRTDSNDHQSYRLSRFTADLGGGLMLARHLSPHNGSKLPGSHIIVLAAVGTDEMTEIYDSWPAFDRDMHCPHAAGTLLKLVLPPNDEEGEPE